MDKPTTAVPGRVKDLTGQKFGKLTVVEFSHTFKKCAYWKCKCDCGGEKIIRAENLKNGYGDHCGCVKRRGKPKIDMVGKRIGTLTVVALSDAKPQGRKEAYWLCRCDCGATKIASGNGLRYGECFCSSCQTKVTKPIHDLTGQRFGSLLVLREGKRTKQNKVQWVCKCDCGNIKSTYGYSLLQGDTVTCGCGQSIYPGLGSPTHGEAGQIKSARYTLWASAKARAKKDNIPFTLTLEDIFVPDLCPLLGTPLRPSKGKGPMALSPTLDKIIPELGYVPGNVWVISHRANTIKSDASLEELKTLTDNLEKKLNELNSDLGKDEPSTNAV